MKLLLYSHSGVCKNDDSYDDMITCDNNACAIQWFHYSCVNKTANQVPEGCWYCPDGQ